METILAFVITFVTFPFFVALVASTRRGRRKRYPTKEEWRRS